jgi:hypothetical protein
LKTSSNPGIRSLFRRHQLGNKLLFRATTDARLLLSLITTRRRKLEKYQPLSVEKGENPARGCDQWHNWQQRPREDIMSGRKSEKDRPGFAAMLKAAHQRKFDVLVFWALDRLTFAGLKVARANGKILGRPPLPEETVQKVLLLNRKCRSRGVKNRGKHRIPAGHSECNPD